MRPALASLRSSRVVSRGSARLSYRQRWISTQPSTPDTSVAPGAESKDKGKEKEKPTAEASAKAAKAAKGDDTLPLLQRPLGTWADTKEKFLDRDKQLEERTHLAREATRGYFSDLNATRRHGGKTWIAPKVMIREDKALYFPDIRGTVLAGSEDKVHTTILLKDKVSVVALLTTRISEIQTAQFLGPTLQAFSSNPLFQFVQINLQDNLLKSFLVSLFASGIRKTVSESLWPTYMISSQNMEYLRQPLGIANKHVGYVYLVDPKLKIRWAACADPKSEEVSALKTCTTVLLDRLSKQQDSPAEPAPDSPPPQETTPPPTAP
ncbi:ATP10 protein-domain-containing protein [Cerioporus squamosus]|nr:ATP10 protein-domain-containing protein [Cerioporus squamosus]